MWSEKEVLRFATEIVSCPKATADDESKALTPTQVNKIISVEKDQLKKRVVDLNMRYQVRINEGESNPCNKEDDYEDISLDLQENEIKN